MLRRLLASDDTDILNFVKACCAITSSVITLVTGVFVYKMLTGRAAKLILTISRVSAGVCLGTAMMDMLSESAITFYKLGCTYPLAFMLSCTGYVVAMLIDCFLARVANELPRACLIKKLNRKLLDKIMLLTVKDLEPTKCCDTTLPVGTSKAETKDCDGIGYLRYLILYRATMFVDYIFMLFTFGVLSMIGGVEIGNADTQPMAVGASLKAIMHIIMHLTTLVCIVLRSAQNISFIKCLFFVCFSATSAGGIVVSLMDTTRTFRDEAACKWAYAIYLGISSGGLVYLSVHHLLADGYELERSASDTRFGKIVNMVCGLVVVALLKVLDIM